MPQARIQNLFHEGEGQRGFFFSWRADFYLAQHIIVLIAAA